VGNFGTIIIGFMPLLYKYYYIPKKPRYQLRSLFAVAAEACSAS